MRLKRHGILIGIERFGSDVFISLKAIGKLTHEDYGTISPAIGSALNAVEEPRVKVLMDGTDFEGWELQAACNDLKIGLKHGNELIKVAINGNDHWQEVAAKVGAWFVTGEVTGEVKRFDNDEDALAWLSL